MSCFDEEPELRRLMYHAESDNLFEVFYDGSYVECLDNNCDDVTGEDNYEKLFKAQHKEGLKQ